jgi:hypothetical protein
MQYILDACTIINILHIDEDEFLLKKLSSLEFKICKTVYDETRKNVFKKFERIRPYPSDRSKLIERKLNYFRERIHNDESYNDLSDSVLESMNYPKRNGEYFSILLSYYLNTFEKCHILFFTDDSPAKEYFTPHLGHNKIGYIEDSVDLLILLYRQNQEFTTNDLKKLLSSLYYEYVVELGELEKEINGLDIPSHHIRNKDASLKLNQMRVAIKNLKLDEAYKIYVDVCGDTKKYNFLYEVLSKYSSFFEKKLSSDFLKKIKDNISYVDSKPFYKYYSN